jgi:hypothetical protein
VKPASLTGSLSLCNIRSLETRIIGADSGFAAFKKQVKKRKLFDGKMIWTLASGGRVFVTGVSMPGQKHF